MLAVLPCVYFILVFILLRSLARHNSRPIRESLLLSAVICGVSVFLFTETLSLFKAVTPLCVTLVWTAGIVTVAACIVARFSKTAPAKPVMPVLTPFDTFLLCLLLLVVLISGSIAIAAPPNTWDSMTYHMSRVMHWIQNRTVSFYPTNTVRQLYSNPWAEYAILHFQVLSDGDHFANLVQWFSMLGCIVGASLIAHQFGTDRHGQLLSGILVATIPMGILQASSTQNDYVASFWMITFAYYCLLLKQEIRTEHLLAAGISLGLALLTKGTAYIYAFPFIVWLGISLIKTVNWQKWLGAGTTVVSVAFLINLPHYARNFSLSGSPTGPHTIRGFKFTNDFVSFPALVSNVIRNTGLHMGTPFQYMNGAFERVICEIHSLMNIHINDARLTWKGTQFHVRELNYSENTSGNLAHLILIVVSLLLIAYLSRKKKFSVAGSYPLVLVSAGILFAGYLRWQPWHSRLHLPLFVLWMPFVAATLRAELSKTNVRAIGITLILLSTPWLLYQVPRSPTARENVFNTNRTTQYFRNYPGLEQTYRDATAFLEQEKHSQIGLLLGGNDLEYPLFVLLGKANSTMRLEHVHVNNGSSAIQMPPFDPTAIVVTSYRKKDKWKKKEELSLEGKIFLRAWESDNSDVIVFVAGSTPGS